MADRSRRCDSPMSARKARDAASTCQRAAARSSPQPSKVRGHQRGRFLLALRRRVDQRLGDGVVQRRRAAPSSVP